MGWGLAVVSLFQGLDPCAASMVLQLLHINGHASQKSMHPYISLICSTGPFKPSSAMQIGQALRLTSWELYFNRLDMKRFLIVLWWAGFWAIERVDRLTSAP